MPTDPFTTAELDAAAVAVAARLDRECGCHVAHDLAAAALAAVLPDHDARVRAEVAEQIARCISATVVAGVAMPSDLCSPSGGRPPVSAYAEWASRIARAHATTEEPS